MTKICAACGKEKDVSEFHKNSKNKDGLHSYCKSCNAERAKKHNQSEKGKLAVKKAQNKQFESGYFKYGKGAIINMSKSAKKRGKEFNLTEDQLKKWWEETPDICYYCGTTISEYINIRDFIINYQGDDWTVLRFKRFFEQDIYAKISDMTIDRANNSIGYEINNIVKSCWICNSMKSNFFTKEEMIIIGKLLMDNLKKGIY